MHVLISIKIRNRSCLDYYYCTNMFAKNYKPLLFSLGLSCPHCFICALCAGDITVKILRKCVCKVNISTHEFATSAHLICYKMQHKSTSNKLFVLIANVSSVFYIICLSVWIVIYIGKCPWMSQKQLKPCFLITLC